MSEPIPFAALVGLMVLGTDAPDSCAGTIHARDVVEVDDDYVAADGERIEAHPLLGRVAVTEYDCRLVRRGPLSRREGLDGIVLEIDGADADWYLDAELGGMVMRPHASSTLSSSASPIGGLDIGGNRPSWGRWDGIDFTRPTGPIAATEFLGRAAWAVELAPPRHKPHPIQLVVDAATGIALRAGNRDVGSVTEWTSLEVGVEPADDLFVWDGPSHPPRHADHEAELEQDLTDRTAWLAARGVVGLSIPITPELLLNAWDDEAGSFHLSFDVAAGGSLLRRRHDDATWAEADRLGWDHVYRWSDERWDWCLGSDAHVPREQLALLRVRLATTT